MRLFQPPLRARTAGLAFVWFSLSFGWYGLMLWLPEYFTRLTPDSSAEGIGTRNVGGTGGEVYGDGGGGGGGGGGGVVGPDRRVYTENMLVAWWGCVQVEFRCDP
jgi:hypothetical protein